MAPSMLNTSLSKSILQEHLKVVNILKFDIKKQKSFCVKHSHSLKAADVHIQATNEVTNFYHESN
jgi:hypothetical protein